MRLSCRYFMSSSSSQILFESTLISSLIFLGFSNLSAYTPAACSIISLSGYSVCLSVQALGLLFSLFPLHYFIFDELLFLIFCLLYPLLLVQLGHVCFPSFIYMVLGASVLLEKLLTLLHQLQCLFKSLSLLYFLLSQFFFILHPC